MDGFSTHLPILQWVVETVKPKKVLELGVGLFSTSYLIENAQEVTSIETASEKWLDDVKLKHGNWPGWTPIFSKDNQWIPEALKQQWGMVFVDCDAVTRPEWLSEMQKVSPVIVVHDVECRNYGWPNASLQPGYVWVDVTEQPQWTAIITNNYQLAVDALVKFDSYSVGKVSCKRYLF